MQVKILQRRIKKAQALLNKQSGTAALLVSSAALQSRSRDTMFPFRQQSDFYYFTAALHQEAALLISSIHSKPILLCRKPTKEEIVWDGQQKSLRPLATSLGVEYFVSSSPKEDILDYLKGIDILFAHNEPGTLAEKVSHDLFAMPSYLRQSLPLTLAHAELLMMELRLYKDREEIAAISRAIDVTWNGMLSCVPHIRSGTTECALKSRLESSFLSEGCHTSFPSIVASGKAAATLHYQTHTASLKNNQMLLIDCGAEWNMYAGDITRVFPIGGQFSEVHRTLYTIVLEAQKAAIDTICHNVPILKVYEAAARILTEGLKDLNVLSGSTKSLMSNKAYQPYFPHGIGHSLGIDVHDVGKLRGNNNAVLQKGMVFTVEPGLYFPRKTGEVSACGIRIEDDILVTASGAKNLSAQIPKELDDIEALFE